MTSSEVITPSWQRTTTLTQISGTGLAVFPPISGFDAGLSGHEDHLVRVVNATSSPVVSVVQTKTVLNALHQWESRYLRDIDTLKELVDWQHKLLDYSSLYQAFLMEQVSDEEFAEEAEKFSYAPIERPVAEVASIVADIVRLTKIQYSISDLADFFRCNEDVIEGALDEIGVHPRVPSSSGG